MQFMNDFNLDRNNMLNNNSLVQRMVEEQRVPGWAMAEGMNQVMGLDALWNCADRVEKKRSHLFRKKMASALHRLANVVDEKEECNSNYGLQRA